MMERPSYLLFFTRETNIFLIFILTQFKILIGKKLYVDYVNTPEFGKIIIESKPKFCKNESYITWPFHRRLIVEHDEQTNLLSLERDRCFTFIFFY